MGNPLTLSNCRELRELEIYASRPGTMELDLISSITSTNMQRITFARPLTPQETPTLGYSNWPELDDSLCRLVDRLECGLQLEVEFKALNGQAWWDGELGFRKHLPKFYEKGKTGGG